MQIDSLTPEVDPQGQMQIVTSRKKRLSCLRPKNPISDGSYLDWAQYPITEMDKLESGGYIVRFRDLRFEYFSRGRNPLAQGLNWTILTRSA